MSIFLWMSIPVRKYPSLLTVLSTPHLLFTFPPTVLRNFFFSTVFMAITVVWTVTRNPRKDVTLAELPSPTASEDYYRPAWSSANVADGIEDDSLEPEGDIRLV